MVQAWRDLELDSYMIADNPRAFVNRITCKFSALEAKFPHKSLPNKEKLIKRKLYQGLPTTAQRRVNSFLDDAISLNFFLELVEHERQIELVREEDCVHGVYQAKQRENTGAVANAYEGAKGEDRFEKLQQSLLTLTENMKSLTTNFGSSTGRRTPNPRPEPRPCGWCANGSKHYRLECPRKPPVGSCFDCLQPGVRKGHTGCVGRPRSTTRSSNTTRDSRLTATDNASDMSEASAPSTTQTANI